MAKAEKIYPIPHSIIAYFDYKYIRYFKTLNFYCKTHQFSNYFYPDCTRGFVQKITKKEYIEAKKEMLRENAPIQDKGVQTSLF